MSGITNAERAARKAVDKETEREKGPRARKLGPPTPFGFGWGGPRRGAGRPKGSVRVPPKKEIMVRMDKGLAEAINGLPRGKRSEYVRQALDLMKDISPPETFSLASGKEQTKTDETD